MDYSIVIPSYNYEEYVEQRLSSIFRQTFQDFEIILELLRDELARRLEGRQVGVWSLHPGAVATRLGANNGGLAAKIVTPMLGLFFKSPEQGARTSIHLCSEPRIDAPNGTYFAKLTLRGEDGELTRTMPVTKLK